MKLDVESIFQTITKYKNSNTTMANIIELEQTCESYPVQYWA